MPMLRSREAARYYQLCEFSPRGPACVIGLVVTTEAVMMTTIRRTGDDLAELFRPLAEYRHAVFVEKLEA